MGAGLLKILDELSIANIKEKEYEEVINIIGDNSIENNTFEALLLRLFREKDKKSMVGKESIIRKKSTKYSLKHLKKLSHMHIQEILLLYFIYSNTDLMI